MVVPDTFVSVLPSPSCPLLPLPKARTSPSSVTNTVYSYPQAVIASERALTQRRDRATRTGRILQKHTHRCIGHEPEMRTASPKAHNLAVLIHDGRAVISAGRHCYRERLVSDAAALTLPCDATGLCNLGHFALFFRREASEHRASPRTPKSRLLHEKKRIWSANHINFQKIRKSHKIRKKAFKSHQFLAWFFVGIENPQKSLNFHKN